MMRISDRVLPNNISYINDETSDIFIPLRSRRLTRTKNNLKTFSENYNSELCELYEVFQSHFKSHNISQFEKISFYDFTKICYKYST